MTKEEALALLRKTRTGWEARKKRMKDVGFRAYTTSVGWLGYPVDKVVRVLSDCCTLIGCVCVCMYVCMYVCPSGGGAGYME